MFSSVAYAQTAGELANKPHFIMQILPMLLVFAVFYFLVLRPQSKRAKEHQNLVNELKRGMEVITTSGIVGKIDGVNDQFVTLEIAANTKIKVLKRHIGSQLKEQL